MFIDLTCSNISNDSITVPATSKQVYLTSSSITTDSGTTASSKNLASACLATIAGASATSVDLSSSCIASWCTPRNPASGPASCPAKSSATFSAVRNPTPPALSSTSDYAAFFKLVPPQDWCIEHVDDSLHCVYHVDIVWHNHHADLSALHKKSLELFHTACDDQFAVKHGNTHCTAHKFNSSFHMRLIPQLNLCLYTFECLQEAAQSSRVVKLLSRSRHFGRCCTVTSLRDVLTRLLSVFFRLLTVKADSAKLSLKFIFFLSPSVNSEIT